MDHQPWRNQSDEQHPAKIPKLPKLTDSAALPVFSPEPDAKRTTSSTLPPASFPRMGSLFSLAQWQELELQAQIYKYMMIGASVPLELILPFVSPSPFCQYQHFQPSMFQSGYWGRCMVDPEPGRCRRTDGKKWRCSKDVVAGQKYCERHVHRGRNRSRKLVEVPTTNGGSGYKAASTTTAPSPTLPALAEMKETHFTPSGQSSTLGILPLDQRPPDGKTTQGCLKQRTDSRVLMRFFDDWPSCEKQGTAINNNASPVSLSTQLSISIPENSSSDFALKLSTGNTNNWSLWENHRDRASMGGPLAEALRSSASSPSPTSVFRKLNGSVSEASSTST